MFRGRRVIYLLTLSVTEYTTVHHRPALESEKPPFLSSLPQSKHHYLWSPLKCHPLNETRLIILSSDSVFLYMLSSCDFSVNPTWTRSLQLPLLVRAKNKLIRTSNPKIQNCCCLSAEQHVACRLSCPDLAPASVYTF